jgi:hypothetical protein
VSDFDPDAYLAGGAPPAARPKPRRVKPAAFDPDAYLASDTPEPPPARVTPGVTPPLDPSLSPGYNPDGEAAPKEAPLPSEGAAIGYGAARGASLGLSDRIAGAIRASGQNEQLQHAMSPAGSAQMGEIPKLAEANRQASEQGRAEYLAREAAARKAHPGTHMLAELGAGAVTSALNPIGRAVEGVAEGAPALVRFGARLVQPAAEGAVAGAANAKPGEAGKGALLGSATNILGEATAGTLMRSLVRNAPELANKRLTRDIVESDAGRASGRTVKKMTRDIEDVLDVVNTNGDLKAASRGEAVKGLPVVQEHLSATGTKLGPLYDQFDSIVQPTNLERLRLQVAAAEAHASNPAEARAFKKMKDDLMGFWGHQWGLEPGMSPAEVKVPTRELRRWTSAAQRTAEEAITTSAPRDAEVIRGNLKHTAEDILNSHLDSGGEATGGIVAEVRKTNREYSAVKRLEDVLLERADQEKGQKMGIWAKGKRAGALTAAATGAGMMATGQPVAGAAVAASPMLIKAGSVATRAAVDALATIQTKAAQGVPWAEIVKYAAETGVPASAARAVYDRVAYERAKR